MRSQRPLNLRVCPLNWPIGMGRSFKGVVDLQTKMVSLYTPEKHGTQILTEELKLLDECRAILGDDPIDQVEEELELLEVAGDLFTQEDFLAGRASPVF